MSSRKDKLRTRNYLQEPDPFFFSKTAKQWQAQKRALNADAVGEEMWVNALREYKADYFTIDETHPATPEELEEWRKAAGDKKLRELQTRRTKSRVKRAREKRLIASQEAEREAELWISKVMDASGVICFAMKTNGLSHHSHEILQLSIIDGSGQILFDEYIRPYGRGYWDGRKTHAMTTHGITPEMVQDKPTIDKHVPKLRAIFAAAKTIVWYNSGIVPDLAFIERAGIKIPKTAKEFDMIEEFSILYREWDADEDQIEFPELEYQTLETCAEFYNYRSNGNFHPTLEEAYKILHCYNAMT